MIETIRKILLTAVISIVSPGSAAQIVFGIVVELLFMKLYSYCRPFKEHDDNTMQKVRENILHTSLLPRFYRHFPTPIFSFLSCLVLSCLVLSCLSFPPPSLLQNPSTHRTTHTLPAMSHSFVPTLPQTFSWIFLCPFFRYPLTHSPLRSHISKGCTVSGVFYAANRFVVTRKSSAWCCVGSSNGCRFGDRQYHHAHLFLMVVGSSH